MDVRSLSPTEAKVILSLEAEGRDTVSLSEIQRRAEVSPGFARKLAHGLIRKGWLQRVHRSVYLLSPSQFGPEALPDTDPLRLGSRLIVPYYFGFATAAELHGLLPQASHVYYLVTTSRPPVGKLLNGRFRFIRLSERRFFGAHVIQRRNEELRVSDLERTVLDCLSRPDFSGGMAGVSHILAIAKPDLNWGRLGSYLDRYGNRSLELRTGYLVEHVRPSVRPPAGWLTRRLARQRDRFVPLGPPKAHGRTGSRNDRWHIIQNVSDAELFAEGEIR
ncbi:MAG: type IV toxin-antitoxin system AbiEi family antitoxin [Thermoplasmata archaeon]